MRNRTRGAIAAAALASAFALIVTPVASADGVDQAVPKISPKVGTTLEGPNRSASFALSDDVAVDFVEVNGVKKDLSNNKWSDLNGLRPGLYGGVEGSNTVTVVDTSNKRASVVVTLDTLGPTITVKPESVGVGNVYRTASVKLYDNALVDRVVINGVVKDLSNNKWSDVNSIKPGVFGAVEGQNVFEAYDVLGNKSSWSFVLDTTAPVVAERTQVYNPKGGGRTDVTLVFTESVSAISEQGWYGSGAVWTKAFYANPKLNVAVNFVDTVGNAGFYKFDYVPSPAPAAPLSFGSSSFGSSGF